MSDAMRAMRPDEPLMVDWQRFKQTDTFVNSSRWAREPSGVDGSLWAMFMAGFIAATERAGNEHECVNPASDLERQEGSPGAGAMGAVLEYRDLIRRDLP